jgi:CubicO group peptidase (beta-lactamase class C family)
MIRRLSASLAAALVAVLTALAAAPAVAQAPQLDGLDRHIERGLADWEIPGLAIAVVHGDSIVFARGFGVRELGSAEPVDERTLFAIGSASKPFAAATVAMLVDNGDIAWNDPAIDHLPGFQLFDPYATRELTVRDLLTHRSGLSRGDFLWYGTEHDRSEILRRVRHLEPSWSFRSQFGYQNILYLASGEVVREVSGESWDDAVRTRIFAPLGMNESGTSIRELEGRPNVATPHARIDEEVRPIAWRNIDNIAPAGSINSNVLDMAQWIRLNLSKGTFEGQEILSEDAVDEMLTPQTIVPLEGGWRSMAPVAHFFTYGIGWFMNDHYGRKVVQHGGNIDGMTALVGLMPERDVGVVILTNLGSAGFTYPLMYDVFDRFLGVPATDWSGSALARADSVRAEAAARRARVEEARHPNTEPSLSLSEYAGEYEDAMYGTGRVTVENGGLILRLGPAFVGDLAHWHHDTFEVRWRDPSLGTTFVSFGLDAMGKVRGMDLQGMVEFARVADASDAVGAGR